MAATPTGELIGGSWHGGRGIDCDFVSFSSLQTHLRCGRQKLWDTDQIVCRGREDKEPFDQVAPPMPGLAQAADRLDPTERLFDPLSLDHTDGIARMPGGTAIDGGAAIGVILRNMRCAATLAAAGDEVGGVVEFIGPHRAARSGIAVDHIKGGGELGRAGGLGQPGIDNEIVAVLGHHMTHVTELGLLAEPFAEQPSIGVCGRTMRIVRAFLTTEVTLGVAPAAARRRRFAVRLRHKTLHAGPGLDQRAVNREVLARQKCVDLRQVQHTGKELGRDIAIEQAIPVLAEHGGIPDRIVGRQSDEPAEQQIVVELLHQLPFRAHRVKRLQQQRPQQSLRRDRWPTVARVQLVEVPRQSGQRRVGQRADRSQRTNQSRPASRITYWVTSLPAGAGERVLGVPAAAGDLRPGARQHRVRSVARCVAEQLFGPLPQQRQRERVGEYHRLAVDNKVRGTRGRRRQRGEARLSILHGSRDYNHFRTL